MMNILTGLTMLPLRVNLQNFNLAKQPSTSISGTTVAIIMVVITLIVVALYFINKKVTTASKKSGGGVRRYSYFALHRIARDIGLNRDQTRMFEYVLKTGGISDPEDLLNDSTQLDRNFKRAYTLIERTASTTEDLNNRFSMLFSTRNIIEAYAGSGNIPASTRQIPEKSSAVLSVSNQNYPVKIISSRGDALVIENPVTNTGRVLNLSKGSKAHLAVVTKSNRGFTIETRILDSMETSNGHVVQLAHSGEIKRLSNRRFRRRQTVIATSFYLVHVEATGRKQTKMVVDKRRFSGNIMDVSMGGCSIKTNTPVNSGQRLKIEFSCKDGSSVAALGEVLRTNRTGVNTVMHIKFLKVPRKSLNAINAMVFEYTDD
jgi:hypothetical protein